jgi:hypothetical protein
VDETDEIIALSNQILALGKGNKMHLVMRANLLVFAKAILTLSNTRNEALNHAQEVGKSIIVTVADHWDAEHPISLQHPF